jgi:threonine/homoserine/homoserine lactone efflux protein
MDQDALLALAGFALATSVTPGPNNMMLLASGATWGFARSLPHMLGISLGHSGMVVLVGMGVGQAVLALPGARAGLALLASGYMLWLAWKIATAAPPAPGAAPAGRPFTFLQAAAFQWVNPKAWAMALTATTVHAPGTGLAAMGIVAGVFAVVNLPCIALWAGAGQGLRRWLAAPGRLRAFNLTMAGLLVASLAPLLAG